MDFRELLSAADYNKDKAQYEASVKRYNSNLPPPKKVPKSNVMPENVRKFLEKKKAEEVAKAAEEQKRKEQLLALRAQNSKNSKKAKIMASRTKDNDFSKIKLTEDEIEAKKKREAELIRKNLNDKVERMKARIEMEEKEKLLPRKRKRKSKNGEVLENHDNSYTEDVCIESSYNNLNDSDKNVTEKSKVCKPKPKAQPPKLSFTELLKVAQNKQFEPVEIVVKKQDEERPMTKKERMLMEWEQARLKRKEERMRLANGLTKSVNSSQITNTKNASEKSNKPVVIHVEKDNSKQNQESAGKFKIPKSTVNVQATKTSTKNIEIKSSSFKSSNKPLSNMAEKSVKVRDINEQNKVNSKTENVSSLKDREIRKKILPKKNGVKINPASALLFKQPSPTPPAPKIDEEALTAAIEKRIREKIEREMEEKFAKYSLQLQKTNSQPEKPNVKKVSETPKQVIKKEPISVNSNKSIVNKPILNSKKDVDGTLVMKKQIMEQKKLAPKLPEKKVFHKNPYLDPPRRLLEPQRPPKLPPKRRIESDDDEDDDMSDFIDDGPSQNEEDYSKYIKEIFGYDRSRYLDDDDDDVMESSFAEQMKEEVRSAKLGYLEDLEEERLEKMARKKKKKLKK